MSSANDSANTTPRGLTIVVGFDFSDADALAFDQAARLAQRAPGCELHLVHVFDGEPSAERSRDIADHLRLYVAEKAAFLGGLTGVTVGIHLRHGKPVREIVQLATEVGADLVVVGSHPGPNLKQWLLGSTAERLLRVAPCPVVVAAPRHEQETHLLVIEPPCPDCVSARAASGGSQWWCERHSHRVYDAHAFSYERELSLTSHDSGVIPTGIDF